MNQKLKVMIAGGGTGGHIYPALGIAKALEAISPGTQIFFVGTDQGMETKVIPKQGYELFLVQGGKLNLSGRWKEKLLTLLKLPVGLLQSFFLILRHKPNYVLGVGGYASGPFVLVASLCGIPTGIWEPNAHPGLANRWLSRFVRDCFLVFEEAKSYLAARRYMVEGMPVRREIEEAFQKSSAASAVSSPQFRILCFGGSQGSRVINNALFRLLEEGRDFSGVHLVHQIGSADWLDFQRKYQALKKPAGFDVDAREFIFDMPEQYQKADLVICRGGASTLAEVAAFGVPPIVIPLPAADNHQERNAEALEKSCGATLILQKDLTSDRLYAAILAIKKDQERRLKISQSLRIFFRPNAAQRIAESIVKGTEKL